MARNIFHLQFWQYFYLFGVTCRGMKDTGKMGFAMEGAHEGLIMHQTYEKFEGTRVLFQFVPQSVNFWIFTGFLTFLLLNVSIFDGQQTLA